MMLLELNHNIGVSGFNFALINKLLKLVLWLVDTDFCSYSDACLIRYVDC